MGADVLNLSLGSVSGNANPNSPEQRALTEAAHQGVIPVVAAGNAGLSTSQRGLNQVNNLQTKDGGTVGSPGVDQDVLTVASSDNLPYDAPEKAPRQSSQMSSFTSYGPTPDLQLKPDITAPGGALLSSLNDNQYGKKSGTSMATPVVAGATALLTEKWQGKLRAVDRLQVLKTILMNSAHPLQDKNHPDAIISPRAQGAGLVQIDRAINQEVLLTGATGRGAVTLKDFQTAHQSMQVVLDNRSDKDQTYRYQPDAVYTDGATRGNPAFDQKLKDSRLTLQSATDGQGSSALEGTDTIHVKAGSQTRVNFVLDLPDQVTNNFVEGYLRFDSLGDSQGPGGKTLSIPYLGYYGQWNNQAIFDDLAWSKNSYHGQSALYDQNDRPLGLTPQGTIDPANIAIAPGVSAFREARPFLNLFRNAKTVTSTIFASQPDCPTQPSAQALATVNITPKATKSYYSYSLRGFTHYQDSQARWRGQVYNAKTGLDDPVPDGQYYYQVSAQPMGVSNISPQKLTLPVKVDSQAPTINNSQLVPGSDNQVHFKTTLADALSGLDAFGRIGLTVNGVFEIYSFHLDQSHQVTADVDLTLTKVQQETVKAGANQVRVMVYDNAGNLADVQADLSGDQVASLVAPGSPKDSDQPQTGQNKADPAKSGEPTKVDQPKVGPVGSKSPTKDNQPGSSNGSRQPGTQPVKSENDKTAAKKAEDPLVVFDHHIRLGSNTISAQNSSYNLKKQELTISGRVRSDCRQATLLIGEKDGQGQTVAIDPQSLTFTTTIPAPPNAKVSVPIRLQQDGQDKLVGGLQFYLDTTLPELSLFEEKSFERLYNGYYQIKTNQDHYKLTGQAGDNYDGYRIFINGNMVARKNFSMTFNQKNNGSVTQFAVPMALTTGDNYADIRVYDASGNFSSKTFNVRYYQADLPKPTVQRSETKPTQYPILLIPRATLPKDVPADDAVKIEYSEDQGQTWSEYQYQLSIYQNTTILFRSVDSYGNHSPVVAEKIANIKGGRAGVPAPNQPRTPTPVKPSQPTNPGHGTGNQPGSQPGQPGVVNSTTRNKHCQHGQSRLRHRVGCRHACLRIGHAIRHQLHLHNRNARRLYHQGTHLIHRINHQIRRNTRHLIHGGLGWLRRIY